MSLPVDAPESAALDVLSRFRVEFYDCLYARQDALFELTDAVLCTDGPVKTLVELSLAIEHRRGHGALYAALDRGWCEPARLRRTLAGLPLPRAADGRIVLAVDVSNWLRPDAPTSDDRLFCHVYGRGGRSKDQFVPGWPYSFVAALETGRTSWTALLDAVRLGRADDATAVTADQLRDVVTRLRQAGQWHDGDPEIWVVMDSGYDVAYLSHALADLPVVLVGRLRSDRVMLRDAGPARSGPKGGRPRKHGGVLSFARPDSWHEPEITTATDTTRYGKAEAMAWDRMHPRLTHRGPWLDLAEEELPILHGTLMRLKVERLPGDRDPKPVWLWVSSTAATPADVDRWWQAFLRRFDLEHTFRLMEQTLGWTAPKIRHADSADLWTWLVIAAHTQLRLARPLAEDLRRPWERSPGPRRLTPARVRRGFRNIRATAARLSHGFPRPRVKSDSMFGSSRRGDVGVWIGGAELPAVRPRT
ncbi:NF041680 family putative transposase [Kitasatospora purpeofusca]|uniref:NF041680 family putative transposase n=1 Tax=Kitasatospora purpeofusca TaxID=67352 RepID=UPI002259BB44|nr:NF041680 family putative transposase [Kitasatospora purpeofusca]MCX4752054.1 transposase [Kitasatospora purpeofusca]WSR31657.1 transposase [Kitasatospora purpeofusca]